MEKDYSEFINKDLQDFIESKGFRVEGVDMFSEDEMYIDLYQTTPLNRDWIPTIVVDKNATLADVADAFQEAACDFNVNREVIIEIDNWKLQAQKSREIPDIQSLLDDAKWQKETFMEFGRDLQREFADCNESLIEDEYEAERD